MKEKKERRRFPVETCSFCGRSIGSNVQRMIKSPIYDSVYICDSCINIADDTIAASEFGEIRSSQYRKSRKHPGQMEVVETDITQDEICDMTPHGINKELNRFIVGQDHVKKSISVALSNHLKRIHDTKGLIKK